MTWNPIGRSTQVRCVIMRGQSEQGTTRESVGGRVQVMSSGMPSWFRSANCASPGSFSTGDSTASCTIFHQPPEGSIRSSVK